MNIIIVIIITILLSGFFSGMEIAFISANKLQMEIDKKQNMFASGILRIFSENPSQYITTMLIGNNLALVIYGAMMAQLIEPSIRTVVHSDGVVLLIQTIISTLIILFLAENTENIYSSRIYFLCYFLSRSKNHYIFIPFSY